MNDLRELGATRARRVPPPALLEEIRKDGRRRLRLAAVSAATASVVVSAAIAVGVTGAARASGGDRLTPAVPAPTASPDPHGHRNAQAVTVAPPARPQGGADTPAAVPYRSGPATSSVASPDAPGPEVPIDPGYDSAPLASPSPSPSPSATGTANPPGVQDRVLVHRGLSACDVRTTPSGYCGRVTTTQATGVVTIVTEVCWSDGNTDPGSLSFDSTLETDDVVSSGGQQVWDWAQDKSFSGDNTTLAVQPGDCWDWTTQWQPPKGTASGTYQVEGRSYAGELPSGQDHWTATFTLP